MVMLIMIMTGMNDSSINDNVIRVMPFSKYIENDRFNNCDIEIKMDNMMKKGNGTKYSNTDYEINDNEK